MAMATLTETEIDCTKHLEIKLRTTAIDISKINSEALKLFKLYGGTQSNNYFSYTIRKHNQTLRKIGLNFEVPTTSKYLNTKIPLQLRMNLKKGEKFISFLTNLPNH